MTTDRELKFVLTVKDDGSVLLRKAGLELEGLAQAEQHAQATSEELGRSFDFLDSQIGALTGSFLSLDRSEHVSEEGFNAFIKGMKTGLEDSVEDMSDWAESGRELSDKAARNMTSAFDKSLFAFLKGEFNKIGKIWQDTLDDMLHYFTQFISQLIFDWDPQQLGFAGVNIRTITGNSTVNAASGLLRLMGFNSGLSFGLPLTTTSGGTAGATSGALSLAGPGKSAWSWLTGAGAGGSAAGVTSGAAGLTTVATGTGLYTAVPGGTAAGAGAVGLGTVAGGFAAAAGLTYLLGESGALTALGKTIGSIFGSHSGAPDPAFWAWQKYIDKAYKAAGGSFVSINAPGGSEFVPGSPELYRDVLGSMPLDKYRGLYARGLVPYQAGTPFVPQTTPAIVHRGERIFSASDNKALVKAVEQGGRSIVINGPLIHVEGSLVADEAAMERFAEDIDARLQRLAEQRF